MAVKGGDAVRRRIRLKLEGIRGPQTRKVLQEVLIIGEAETLSMIPIDTSNLANSRFRDISQYPGGIEGRLGFTANYAAYVHDASGKLKGKNRANGRGKYWAPDGEPGFLRKGFEQSIDDIIAAIKRGYKR